jgi:hypothetical protein
MLTLVTPDARQHTKVVIFDPSKSARWFVYINVNLEQENNQPITANQLL